MGTLTHAQIVTEALELAGNTGLSTRAQTWLGLVLRRLAEQFQFPQVDFASAFTTLAAGNGTYQVGGSAGVIFPNVPVRGVQRVLIATNASPTDYEDLTPVPSSQMLASALNQAQQTARPRWFFTAPETDHFLVTVIPTPDRAYTILTIVDSRGASVSAYSASQVNLYPDDWTVIQGVYALALRHQQDERAAAEMSKFEQMMKEDRVRYGNMNNANNKVQLSGPHRNRARSNNYGTGWMGPV